MTKNNSQVKILVIDDNNTSVRVLLETFAQIGIHAKVATSLVTAKSQIKTDNWDIIFAADDFANSNFGNNTPSDLINLLHSSKIATPLIIISSDDCAAAAIRAIEMGASNFLARPIDQQRVITILANSPQIRHTFEASEKIAHSGGYYYMVGSSGKLSNTINIAKKVAPTTAPVMINGENGTGKELVAQLIHNSSKRNNENFVRVNCAALSEGLLESELFGHEKGAFTGAVSQKKGRFERANQGTILLDEITETSLAFQSQLLRVLEQGTIERVGGSKEIPLDIRVISTTNRNIYKHIKDGKFREDLYYRLSVIKITTPALKDRKEDIAELVWHFVSSFSNETHRNISSIDSILLEAFEAYSWPGNIRQLRNAVRSCLILGEGPILSMSTTDWMDHELLACQELATDNNISLAGKSLNELEKQAILATLDYSKGNQTKAAKLLGITDRTLRDKVKRYRAQPVDVNALEAIIS